MAAAPDPERPDLPPSDHPLPGAVALVRQVASVFVELVEANAAVCDQRAAVHRGDPVTLITAAGGEVPEAPPMAMWGTADVVANFETYASRSREWADLARGILDAPVERVAQVTLDAVRGIHAGMTLTGRQLDTPGGSADFTLSEFDAEVRPGLLVDLMGRLTEHLLGGKATRWVGTTTPLEVDRPGEGRFEPGDWWPQSDFSQGRTQTRVEAADPRSGQRIIATTEEFDGVGLLRPFELDDTDAAARREFFAAGGRIELKLVEAGLDGDRGDPPSGVGELSMDNLCGLTKGQLVDYLTTAPVVVDTGTSVADRVDAAASAVPVTWHTDGLFVWSSETAAYVERHDLALPSYVLCHVATRAGVLPDLEPAVIAQAAEVVAAQG